MKNWTIKDQYRFMNRMILFMVAPFFMIAALVGAIVLGLYLFDHPTDIDRFDAAQIMYRESGNEYRVDYLRAASVLADDLRYNKVPAEKRQEVTRRLEDFRSNVALSDLDLADQSTWRRISYAIYMEHVHETQLAAITSKTNCNTIPVDSVVGKGVDRIIAATGPDVTICR